MSELEQSVEREEGYRERPYKDSLGLWTCGIGRCFETNPLSASEWKALLDNGWITISLSLPGSRYLMKLELARVKQELEARLSFWPTLPESVQDVLTEMAYQMGVQKLLSFRMMLDALRHGDFKVAADHGRNSLWAKQTPARAERLMKRMES